jgi:hypothetical protein
MIYEHSISAIKLLYDVHPNNKNTVLSELIPTFVNPHVLSIIPACALGWCTLQ